MIFWFYSKYSIYIYCIVIFIVLLLILEDLLVTHTTLMNYAFSKYIMILHYYRFMDKSFDIQGLTSKYEPSELSLTVLNPGLNTTVICEETYCTTYWSYLGNNYNIKYFVPVYYSSKTIIYNKSNNIINIKITWQ